MDKPVLLAQLRQLLENAPDFGAYTPRSQVHSRWLGIALALVSRWKPMEVISVSSAIEFMPLISLREKNIAKVFSTLHHAIADLELEAPVSADQAFGPGAVYDFYKALSSLLSSATTSLLITDTFLDPDIFDTYLAQVQPTVSTRLLAREYAAQLRPAVQKFAAQSGRSVEVKVSKDFHDRVIFVDGLSCWVLGQSVKDAAKAKPTYLAPLSADVSKLKLQHYEVVWSAATAL